MAKGKPRKEKRRPQRNRPRRPSERITPMMLHERARMETARKELTALKAAHDASLLLHDVLTGLEGPAEDWATPRGRQKIAVGFLSAISLRSSRAAMGIVGWGYVPEATGLKRRIGEALWRSEKVIKDHSGEYARRWVAGKPPSGGARAPGAWEAYSAVLTQTFA